MFTVGTLNTAFAELTSIQGTNPSCANCNQPLHPKGKAHHHSPSIIAFWSTRCPACNFPHIIFNSTASLPPPKPPENPISDPGEILPFQKSTP